MSTKPRLLREARGLSQWRLAQEAQVSGSLLSLYERGRQAPTPAIAERLASILGVDTQDVLEDYDHAGKRYRTPFRG